MTERIETTVTVTATNDGVGEEEDRYEGDTDDGYINVLLLLLRQHDELSAFAVYAEESRAGRLSIAASFFFLLY